MYRTYDKHDVGSLMVSFKMFTVCNILVVIIDQ